MHNPYTPKLKKVIYYKRDASDLFTIRLDWKLKHNPGQFVLISLPGIGECPISICSYSNKYIELNIREVGNVTKNLSKIKKNDQLLVRGPYGKGYPMPYFKNKDIIIIGGGCGIAPLKSVIEYIQKKRADFKDILLYLGFRSPSDIMFERDLKKWEKKFCLNVTFDKAPEKTCYDGKIGFVTDLIEKSKLNNENKVVFMCGPPMMIEKTITILRNKGFNNNQIYLSMERLMYCGIGKCGHCMISGKYTCKDGPVFRYDEIKNGR